MRVETIRGNAGSACYLLVDHGVLLDCGPGTYAALADHRLLEGVRHIVVSHMHADHMLDVIALGDAAAMLEHFAGGPSWPGAQLLLPRPDGVVVLDRLARALADDGMDPWRRLKRAFDVREYDERDTVVLGSLRARFCRTRHSRPCYATRLAGPDGDVTYTADTAWSDALVEFAAGSELLLCEATFTDRAPGSDKHLTGRQAGELAAATGAQRLILVHLGPDSAEHEVNLRAAREVFDGPVSLARSLGASVR
jgi:ribonuclease BN (tRNA processing enzyme)